MAIYSPAASPPHPLLRTPPRREGRAGNLNLSAPVRPRQLKANMLLSHYNPVYNVRADEEEGRRRRRPRAVTTSRLYSLRSTNRGQRCYPVKCSHCGSQFFIHMATGPILAGEEEELRFCGKNCKLTAVLEYRDRVAMLALLSSPSSRTSSDSDGTSGGSECIDQSNDASSLFLRECDSVLV